MNLLMILLIVLAVWVCAAICYFAWRLTPDAEAPPVAGGGEPANGESEGEKGVSRGDRE